jgi:hypothetical protein
MSICPHAVRFLQQKSRPRQRSRLRPWPRLPAAVRIQLAQQLAQVLSRVRDGEAGRADHVE